MPMTTPPPAPGFLAVYENPTLGQFISPGGTSLVTRQDSFDIHPDHWFSLSAARGWRDFWILPLGTPRLAIPSLCFTSTGVPASINGAAYVSLARYRHARAAGFYKGSRNCRATGSCGAFRACSSKGRARQPCIPFCVPRLPRRTVRRWQDGFGAKRNPLI